MRKNKNKKHIVKDKPLIVDDIDELLSSLTKSDDVIFSVNEDMLDAQKDAIIRAHEIRKYLPEEKMTQLGFLDQDLLARMTYQSNLGVRYADNKKDELLKQFNRRIIRNYILSAILGGLVVGGVIMAPKVVKKVTSVAVENNLDMSR